MGIRGEDVSDPLNKRDRPGDDERDVKKRPNVAGPDPKGARVYDRPQGGGRSMISWILVAIVVIALLLWLVF